MKTIKYLTILLSIFVILDGGASVQKIDRE